MSDTTPFNQETVTLLIKHRIKAGSEDQYETWLRRVVGIAAGYHGHLGVDVVRGKAGGLHLFTSVLRFSTTEAMQLWLDSDVRRELITQVAPLLADGDVTEVNTDSQFWFNPSEDAPQPPRWKQAVVSFLVILPLSMLIPLLWGPVFSLHAILSSYLVSNILITATIVLLVVYLCMPLATRLFAPWLTARREQ